MATAFSKISPKNQTTIPRKVCARLGLKPGDWLRYSVCDKGVLLENADLAPAENPFADFREWSRAADEKEFGNLR